MNLSRRNLSGRDLSERNLSRRNLSGRDLSRRNLFLLFTQSLVFYSSLGLFFSILHLDYFFYSSGRNLSGRDLSRRNLSGRKLSKRNLSRQSTGLSVKYITTSNKLRTKVFWQKWLHMMLSYIFPSCANLCTPRTCSMGNFLHDCTIDIEN